MLRSVSLDDRVCLPGVRFGLCFLGISTKTAGVSKVIITTPRCSCFCLSAAHALSNQDLERARAAGVDKGVTDTKEKTHRTVWVLLCIDDVPGWQGFGAQNI